MVHKKHRLAKSFAPPPPPQKKPTFWQPISIGHISENFLKPQEVMYDFSVVILICKWLCKKLLVGQN